MDVRSTVRAKSTGWPSPWSRRGRRQTKPVLVVLAAPPSPFMQTDISLLSRYFPVEVLVYENKRLHMVWRVLKRVMTGRAGLVLLWFAVPSYGLGVSLVARMLRCPVMLITGGYDIANMPEIGFGSMIRPRLRMLVIAMLRMANTILTFSDSARRDVLLYAKPPRLLTAYPGVDVERFHPVPGLQRENLVVTSCFSIGHAFVLQKGLDTFVRAAAYVPEARFVLIGQPVDDAIESLRAGAPPNVEFTERRISDEELTACFQKARVYVQASAHEGFGVAMAEAMAAGCVPVATNATAMPEVVGTTGYLAPFGDAAAFGAAIKAALGDDGTLSRAARERVVQNYTVGHRERILVREVGRLLKRRRASR